MQQFLLPVSTHHVRRAAPHSVEQYKLSALKPIKPPLKRVSQLKRNRLTNIKEAFRL